MKKHKKIRKDSHAYIGAADGMFELGTRCYWVARVYVCDIQQRGKSIPGFKMEKEVFLTSNGFWNIQSISRSRRQIAKRLLRHIRELGIPFERIDGCYWMKSGKKENA